MSEVTSRLFPRARFIGAVSLHQSALTPALPVVAKVARLPSMRRELRRAAGGSSAVQGRFAVVAQAPFAVRQIGSIALRWPVSFMGHSPRRVAFVTRAAGPVLSGRRRVATDTRVRRVTIVVPGPVGAISRRVPDGSSVIRHRSISIVFWRLISWNFVSSTTYPLRFWSFRGLGRMSTVNSPCFSHALRMALAWASFRP
jgi:hypothetical protein